MFASPTVQDVVSALKQLETISRPEGDNEGEAINSPDIYGCLSTEQQEMVDVAVELTQQYVRQAGDFGDEPNKRAITNLNKKGYRTILQPDQYDPSLLVGDVTLGPWRLDISDVPAGNID
ncbi:hypothetical protein [Paraburkholderia caribensis]|uniref:hypothetical protein n=1 Tax=Paraburkholderia caribensis TaxID=75105 RepID=UPI00078D84E9|nr:hypothetical protein [Paraburkholderia caribensis]AMV47827.1 hypothetical protein ATN79_44990 [Paraburkholderia caribensis]